MMKRITLLPRMISSILLFILILFLPLNSLAEENTLTIWLLGNSLSSRLDEDSLSTHLNISVKAQNVPCEYAELYLSNIPLESEPSFDLILLPTYLLESSYVFENGYAARIDSNILMQSVQSMYPQIQEALIHSGILYGFPIIMYPDYYTVNTPLAEKYYGSYTPETMEEYCNLLVSWYRKHGGQTADHLYNEYTTLERQVEYTFSFVLAQYIRTYAQDNTTLTFDTYTFKQCMEALKKLADVQDVIITNNVQPIYITQSIVSPFIRPLNPQNINEQCVLPPGFESDGKSVINASLEYLIIHPQSKNKEHAIALMEYLNATQSLEQKHILYPNFNELVRSENTSVEDYTQYYVYSAETIAEYRNIAESISLKNAPLVWRMFENGQASKLMMEYYFGNITLDQLIKALNECALACTK